MRGTRGVVPGVLVVTLAAGLSGCRPDAGGPEPDRVVVRHLLISFAGKVPGKILTRNQSDARSLARHLFERARKGADFDALEKQYADSQAPGTYVLVNRGRQPEAGEYGRDQMAPGFADIAFRLKVGEIGLCEYDVVRSPFGYHIIKRIE